MSAIIVSAALVAACSGGGGADPSTGTATSAMTVTTAAPTTSAPRTAPTSTTIAATTTTAPALEWEAPAVCPGPCTAPFEVLFTVPAGEQSGIGYENLGREDMEASGPSALALDGTGRVWVLDEVNRRLLAYTRAGEQLAAIDLGEYEVAGAYDIAAGPSRLLLLDVYVATARYRLLELDGDGGLRDVHLLPKGVHFEDGLTGVAAGPAGEIWMELEVGARVAELTPAGSPASLEFSPGYPYPTGVFGPTPGNTFSFVAGLAEVSVQTDADFGGLAMLGLNPDGSFVLQLDEVVLDAQGVMRVAVTAHLFGEDGTHLGGAFVPLDEQFVFVEHPVTVGPDGYVYLLLTRPDHVAVARLNYQG